MTHQTGERRIGAVLVLLAIAVFWLCGTYGLTGPFYYGHYGFHGGSHATWARGTLRHHTVYPVNEPGWGPPDPHTYYIHHPVLTHQLVTLTFAVFGQHESSVRLASLIGSFASLLLLAAVAWRYLGPLAGGAAALVFAFVPINIWYQAHMDPGFPSIACLLAFFWFYFCWLRTGRWRTGIAALAFEFLAGNFEWSPYFCFPVIFAHVAWTGLRRRGRYLTFAALHPLTVILPLVIHFFLVWRINMLADLWAAYHNRTSEIAYRAFSDRMREYAGTLFGPALLVAMLGWLVLVTIRLVRGRGRALDLVGITFAFAMITYMHVFKTAVVTHAYRQLYGNVWAAFAVADFVAAGRLWGRKVSLWRPARRAVVGTVVALVILAVTAIFTARISWAGLMESRLHGGVPGWKTFNPDLRQTALAIEVEKMTRPGDVLHFHNTFLWPPPHRMDWAFYYDRDLKRWATFRGLLALAPPDKRHAVVIFFPNQLHGDELRVFAELANHHRVLQVQDLAVLDLRAESKRHDVFQLAPIDRTQTGKIGQWFEGPYPFPKLLRDRALETKLAARINEGLAMSVSMSAPVQNDVHGGFIMRPGLRPAPKNTPRTTSRPAAPKP